MINVLIVLCVVAVAQIILKMLLFSTNSRGSLILYNSYYMEKREEPATNDLLVNLWQLTVVHRGSCPPPEMGDSIMIHRDFAADRSAQEGVVRAISQ